MNVNKEDIATDWVDPDEIPDLATDEWAKVIDAAPAQRGRPKLPVTKVSTTIRLDPDAGQSHFKVSRRAWPRWR